MRALIQRVTDAAVKVDGETVGEIGKGYLILLGVAEGDTEAEADRIVKKMINLRIFPDEAGKINLSIKQVAGSLLVVSQFTLCADVSRGNRPSFIGAAKPEEAERLYEYFMAKCREEIPKVEHGIFGACMEVSLTNDGPFTIMLE